MKGLPLWLGFLALAGCGGGGASSNSRSVPELFSPPTLSAFTVFEQEAAKTFSGVGADEARLVMNQRQSEMLEFDKVFSDLDLIEAASASRGLAQYGRWAFAFRGLAIQAQYDKEGTNATLSLKATGFLDGVNVRNFEVLTATLKLTGTRPVEIRYRRKAPFVTLDKWSLTVSVSRDTTTFLGQATVNSVDWSASGTVTNEQVSAQLFRENVKQAEVVTNLDSQSLTVFCETGEPVIIILRNSQTAGGTIFGGTPCTPGFTGSLEFAISG